MRCHYCMPAEIFGANYPFLKSKQLLTFSEIVRIARISESLGVEKIRLTGGEPLLRRKMPDLVKQLKNETGVKDIALTTNGLLLPRLAAQLKKNGLNRVNLSLDALDPVTFKLMSGGFGDLSRVTHAVDICQELEIPVKINTVLKKGFNDSQIIPLLEYGMRKGLEVRFIEYMDVGCSNKWDRAEVFDEKAMLETISHHFGWVSPLLADPTAVARYYRISQKSYTFGIIASISRPFCTGCVRGRISSDGKLYTCLFADSGYDLRELLRSEMRDSDILEQLRKVWMLRADRYSELRSDSGQNVNSIEMPYIGG
jgi:GTP 3',8-cyclase